MASTNNLQATLNWCLPHLSYQPLTIGGLEPALTNANMVLQTLLGPPFCWRWNRGSVTFVCTVNIQDYVEALSDFGFIEMAWSQNAAGTDRKEMTVSNCLAATKETGRPAFVAAQDDDNAGNITFRLMALPTEAYSITVVYQKKPVLMASMASLWSPIPDEFSYIYNWGFLSLSSILMSDPRFPIFNQKFLSHLLGAQQGLDELKRNIFLGNWLEVTKAVISATAKTQQGITARSI